MHITNCCESKIAVNPAVKAQMQRLRTEAHVKLSISPDYSYETDQNILRYVSLIQDHSTGILKIYAKI